MDKKKALKIATATTVAASAFVSVAPATFAASTSAASKAVTKAEADAKKVKDQYNAKKLAFKKIDTKAAVSSYNKAVAEVKKLSKGKTKSALESKLKAVKGIHTYAANYNKALDLGAALATATKNVNDELKKADFDLAGAKKDQAALKTATANFSKHVVKGTVYGESPRAQFTAKYLTPAKTAATAVDKKIKAVEAELNDVKVATASVEALELAVKALKDEASVKTAEDLVAPAKADLAKVETKAVKEDLTTRIANAEKAIADKKAELAVPKVESVSAINAKTVTVTFSKALDAKTLKDSNAADVITVAAGEGALDAGTITQELSADGKTLTLKAQKFFKGEYTVKVPFEIVKAVSGQFVSPVNQKVTVSDTTAPVLSSAKATVKDTKDGIKSVTLTFNEDVSSIDTVKIGNQNYTPVIVGNTATINVDLDATKAYDLTVVNATDAAGNMKDVQSAPVTVSVDNVAPSITSVVPAGENKVKVTLDKELKNDSLVLSAKVGTFTTDIFSSAVVNPENKKEYTVTLNSSYLFKNGSTDTVTLTVAKDALQDSLGNSNATEITKSVTLAKDTTTPAVSNVATTVVNGKVTAFELTFNEEVTSLDASKVYVVNSKGEIMSLANVATPLVNVDDNKKVVFTLVNGLTADKYSFDLAEGFVTDKSLAANKNTKYSFMVDVTEAGKPVETTFTIADVTETDNVVTVDFGAKVKATGTGSALNPASYQVNGVTLPSDTKIEFAKDNNGAVVQSQVVITLPEGFVKTSDTKAVFRVTGVQTLDNKVSNPFIKTIDVEDNAAPEAKSFVATDLDEITVTYSEALKAIVLGSDVTDEVNLYDSKGASVAIEDATVSAEGKLVLTVADSSVVTKLTTVETKDSAEILDLAGNLQKVGLTVNK
ncbi:hypothetical protein LCY76_19730 [Fictibacillus sp. KIGAM418]|uniref:SbsC C-terminal domain-containing protein n=1 Tax=Fictibacillus marinisediminis TaxID=2878389 RepID=A0A9X1XDC7_9BACL|nr:hypothetical protein [Fictibacillus marinisediminis]MCK6258802.1 hypothetical protein [Fictibacillus marinisediminis]